MRSRRTLAVAGIVLAAVIAVALAGVSIATSAWASLPTLTAQELLNRVATQAPDVGQVSGEVSWDNRLGMDGLAALTGNDQLPDWAAGAGTGTLYYSDGQLRLDVAGEQGGTVLLKEGSLLLYSKVGNRAVEYSLPQDRDNRHGGGGTPMGLQVTTLLQRLSDYAALTVAQEEVAGREGYVLVLTLVGDNVALQSVRVTFDGVTFIPLRLQLFGEGTDSPVLDAAFTRISYDPIPADRFEFSLPSGATIERKAIGEKAQGAHWDALEGIMKGISGPLTLEQAEAEAGFDLLTADEPALSLRSAYLLRLPEGSAEGFQSIIPDPIAGLVYGDGLQTVLLIQTRPAPNQLGLLDMYLSAQQDLSRAEIAGHPAYELRSPLGTAVIWQQGELWLAAIGGLSQSAMEEFVGAVK